MRDPYYKPKPTRFRILGSGFTALATWMMAAELLHTLACTILIMGPAITTTLASPQSPRLR